ncbi:MAG: DnaD domain protein, partial [Oscillospiraceae bacterium]|nr:DnaD domain protein [Oscillospiraceae bacterium]
DNLKVLLYCLRYGGQNLTDGEIARATGVAAESVGSSLEFWKQRGLFSDDAGVPLSVKSVERLREPEFTPKEISDIVKENKEVDYLFGLIEKREGKLKHHTQKTLVRIIEHHKMKPEVLIMLAEYSFSVGKFTPSYIQKVAVDWLDCGINDIESAEKKIKELKDAVESAQKSKQSEIKKHSKKPSFDLDELKKQIMEEYGDD